MVILQRISMNIEYSCRSSSRFICQLLKSKSQLFSFHSQGAAVQIALF